MKTHSVLFLHFILLGLLSGYLSTNPESVMVQSPEDNAEKTGKIQFRDNLPKTSAFSDISPVVVKIMRPVVIGSEVFWKEVDSENFSRIRAASSQYRNSWRYFRPIQSNQRRVPEKGIADANIETPVSRGRSSVPQNDFKENSGTNSDENRSQMPQITFRGNRVSTNIKEDRPQLPQSDLKGNRETNDEDDRPQMPETNLKVDMTDRGGYDGSQVPQSNRNKGTNNGADKPSMPDGNVKGTNNGETVGDTFPAFTESEEAFFEDDHHIKPADNSPARISADSNFFAGIVNDFAFKLIESLNLESNFVVSPLSIYIALSMCYLASGGRTKAQFEQVLGMNDNAVHNEHLHYGIKDLISLVKDRTSGYELFSANGMFLGKNFTTTSSFEENIKNFYDAELKNLDFTNPDLSLEFINKWVSDSTQDMIRSIINSPPPLQTRLLLLNAIFFKGVWKTQFPIHLTNTGGFKLLDGSDKEARFMRLFDETLPIFRSDEHQHSFIKLPYEGDEVSMIIALPYTAQDKPISSIRDQILCHIRDAMVKEELDIVSIPKFRMEYRISLIRPLQKLGILDIFNRNAVNFTKMRKENDVYVSGFLHKSVIELDEIGTTAAASTSVGLVPLSLDSRSRFIANHPFAFYIIHEPTGLVLFYGKIFDLGSTPAASNNRDRMDMRPPRPNSNRRGYPSK